MSSEWSEVSLGEVLRVSNVKLGEYGIEPRVLSLSKYAGFVPADEYFDKRIASASLENYKIVMPGEWAYSTIHIDEGSIARNTLGYMGVLSPMYTTMHWVGDAHEPEYFQLLLRSTLMLTRYADAAQGTVNRRRSLPYRAFSDMRVLVPPRPVQRRIVDLMAHLDNHLANLRAETGLASALLAASRTTEFRRVGSPSGAPLGDFIKVHHGWAFPSSGCRDSTGDGAPKLIRIGDFARSRDSAFDPARPQEFVGSFPPRFVLRAGDLIVAMTCQTPDGAILGWPARVPSTRGPYLHNQRIGRVQILDPDRASTDYLTHLFASDPFNVALRRTAAGTKVLHTSPGKVEEVRVVLPELSRQQEVAESLDALGRVVSALQCELESLQILRSQLAEGLVSRSILIDDQYDSLLTGVA